MALTDAAVSELRGEFPALQQRAGGRQLTFMDGERLPRYQAIAEPHGYTVTSHEVAAVPLGLAIAVDPTGRVPGKVE